MPARPRSSAGSSPRPTPRGGEMVDSSDHVVGATGGVAFEDGPDRGRVLVFGHQTGGRYSLMEFTVVARAADAPPDFGPHLHRAIEETFLIRAGRLTFLL